MYLEGVIVCVNYGDFLASSLIHNKNLFDKLVVVTNTSDELTKRICNHYHVECVETDVFYENGDRFNKGKGINEGLERLSKKGWVIHMDADIVLPPMTRVILERLDESLDVNGIYGIDRYMVPSYEAWSRYVSSPKLIHEAYIYVHMHRFPLGQRLAEYMGRGYEPIGYFQMWNPKYSGVYTYPDRHGAADRTDVLHAKKFIRRHRHLLPEIVCFHLDSEDGHSKGEMGKNWNGRTTGYFGYPDTERLRGGYRLTIFERIKIWVCKIFCK
jgi:hypothetical protein